MDKLITSILDIKLWLECGKSVTIIHPYQSAVAEYYYYTRDICGIKMYFFRY